MIWVIIFSFVAAVPACPVLFAGLWTQRWFKICWFIALWAVASITWRMAMGR